MKLLIVLSVLIAAFVAACSESNQRTHTKANGAAQKTVADLDAASSNEELAKLKKELEANKNVQIPDIITAVKRKFGRVTVKKEQPKNKEGDSPKILENKEGEDKIKTPSPDFPSIVLDGALDEAIVNTRGEGTDEVKKYVCIQTCEKQIIILKKFENGKIVSVSAFFAAKISDLEIVNSTKKNKNLKFIVASYEASSDSMNLRFEMTKGDNEMILITENFIYEPASFASINFSELQGTDNGTVKYNYITSSKIKNLTLSFSVEQDQVVIRLNNDFGLFGKNATDADQESSVKGDFTH